MRKTIAAAALYLVLAVTALPALAEPRMGGHEGGVQLSGLFNSKELDDMAVLSGNVLAYYTDQVEVGGRAQLGLSGDTLFSLLGEVRYNFPKGSDITPYVGVVAGPTFISAGGGSDTAITVGGIAGAKKYMAEGWALYGEVQMGVMVGDRTNNYFGLGVGALLPF